MTLSRMIQQLLELQQDAGGEDFEVQLEVGEVKAELTDVYIDDAHGCVFIAGEED